MSFEYKYCKYKNKYLKLKENQLGGALYDNIPKIKEEITDKYTISGFLSPLIDMPYKTSKLLFEDEEGKKIHIIKITLNDDDNNPVLFALAGISHKSFMGTSTVILSKLDILATKFKEVYLVEYADFTEEQKKACNERDEILDELKKISEQYNGRNSKKYDELFKHIYAPELYMNNNIASFLHDIIKTDLNLNKVHLLGKCNGAWVVQLLLLKELLPKDNIYKGLYLAVPGIPNNVEILQEFYDIKRLKRINFVFGWVKQDGYRFNWGVKSNDEKKRYDETMKNISKANKIKLKYLSKMYVSSGEEHEKNHHEIFPDMIDDIVKSIK